MKKILFSLTLILLTSLVYAQSTLSFAYSVDDKGYTNSDNAKFTIREGNEIKMIVRSPNGLNTSLLQYKIYFMDAYGNKTYSTTFNQDVTNTWIVAWKGIIPHAKGYYFIEVVNYSGTHICEGIFYVNLD